MKKPKKQRLNVFLLKVGSTLDEVVSDDIKGVKEYRLSDQLDFSGRLFMQATAAKAPSWFSFLKEGTKGNVAALISQSASALLAVSVEKRVFCFVFGFARYWIPDGKIERRFGMITTLNSVDHSALKAIDREELEGISRTTRSQVSASSSMDVFGIDPQRDLIRSVSGKPKDLTFADHVAGADSLVIT